MTGKWLRLRPWARRMWWVSVAGLLIAIAPLVIALVGLAVGSTYLQTYHWVLFISVPLGAPIALLAGIAAGIMSVRDWSKSKAEMEDGK